MSKLIQEKIFFKTIVKAPLQKVYDGFVTSNGLNEWFTSNGSIKPVIGSVIHFNFEEFGGSKETSSFKGKVLEVDIPNKFVFEWYHLTDDGEKYATTIEMKFVSIKEGILIELEESGYRNDKNGIRDMLECASGWGEALTLWKFYIEHGLTF